ncbi:hypothetical protein B5M09_009048 [Aphanomyces astaci]|uniref:A to I editase domain-containing protein n=1 Tax=Aphanomyces astaci TaxID=112090 RepID=A0A3R7Y7V6_APHAT|nr:hypothetical protein B5M09_009048 [Aphanomyces astaci]
MSATTEDGVAAAALAWFRKTIPDKKHALNEHTIFSAIVLHETQIGDDADATHERFQVLSAGTGTKCVGVSGLCRDGFVVADSHAEAVCRRSFLRYLYQDQKHMPPDSIFEFAPVDSTTLVGPLQRRRRLKPSCQLYMYISEAPCGDGALYDLTDTTLEVIHESKLKKQKLDHPNDEVVTVPRRTTGAKQADSTAHSNAIGVARVKSGRSDILPANRTLSMSCSDKLCRWRVEGPGCATFITTKHPFPLSRSATRTSASGLSLNWTFGLSSVDDASVEYTIGARGVKMGAKKVLNDVNSKQKMSSRLSRRRLGRLAIALVESEEGDLSPIATYDALKAAATSAEYLANKRAFRSLRAFQTWRGNPVEFSRFALP